MIYDKKGKYGPEWAKTILTLAHGIKGFRKPSKEEVKWAVEVMAKHLEKVQAKKEAK